MTKRHDEPNLPPIPDGGLSESMPDWLRRPPAWRALGDAEVVRAPSVESTVLPEPDTSAIDPREFLADDDLPPWLRRLGRGREPSDLPVDDDGAVIVERVVSQGPEPERSPPATGGRFAPRQPVLEHGSQPPLSRPAHEGAAIRARAARPAWWQGTVAVLLLAALLVVAVIVIVILAVW